MKLSKNIPNLQYHVDPNAYDSITFTKHLINLSHKDVHCILDGIHPASNFMNLNSIIPRVVLLRTFISK